MHVPDGFLDAPTSIATGVVAAAGVGVALRGARRELDDRTAPMAGLVATFVFAGQMMNFPVGAGTSGHLLGGALAAVLVGPVDRRALHQRGAARPGAVHGRRRHHRARHQHHADGAGRRRRRLARLPGRPGGAAEAPVAWSRPAAAIAALVSVPVAALGVHRCSSRSAARRPVDTGTVLTAMVGWHTLIGIGEAVDHRPRRRQRGRRPPRPRATAPAGCSASATLEIRTRRSASMRTHRPFLVDRPRCVALLVAGVVSFYASGHPDGLEYVAEKTGFLDTAEDSPTADGPFADYADQGRRRRAAQRRPRRRRRASLLVLVLGGGLFWALRRRTPAATPTTADAD